MAVDSNSLMASQAPPDMLLGSEESEKKCSPAPAEPSTLLDTSETTQGTEKTNDGGETVKEGDAGDKTPPQSSQKVLPGTCTIDSSVVWNVGFVASLLAATSITTATYLYIVTVQVLSGHFSSSLNQF